MGLCANLSNVEQVIGQKPAEKENRREQRQDDKYLILFYASEAMSLDLCYLHIRAGDRCAINANVICLFVCFVALRPNSTAMVIAGRSVHLTTLFPGQA